MTDDAARLMLEGIIWPEGPVCPRCSSKKVTALQGKTCRAGLKQCRECRKQFTVTVGTIFESSHINLGDWMFAVASMCASKKGISALQLKHELRVSYETAWFMCHRIRHAMQSEGGFLKGDVQVDETYVGGKPRKLDPRPRKRGRGTSKTPVVALVERDGNVRTRVLADVTAKSLKGAIRDYVHPSATLHTDEFPAYRGIGIGFAGHKVCVHENDEFVATDGGSTNSAESFFALIKRGMYGNFHSVSKKHLFRYCNEFEFRWNNRDMEYAQKTGLLLAQVSGKRLMYKGVAGHA